MSARWQSGEFGGAGIVAPQVTKVVLRLIVANAVVFLSLYLAELVVPGAQYGAFRHFGLRPSAWFVGPPFLPLWQPLTSAFLHGGPWHLFRNMLQLYFFGTMLESILGSRRFLALYLGSLLAGALAYLVLQAFAGPDVPMVGASGAVMGVTVAAAVLRPKTLVIFIFVPLTLAWLAAIFVGIDLLSWLGTLRGAASSTAYSAHLGGAAFGFLAARKGLVWRDPLAAWRRHRQQAAAEQRRSDEQRVDDLLAKISREGMASLSKGEKEFLKRASARR